jgi:hypothetical protein
MNEAEAVKTTIVGGRPPGSGRNNVPVPRGIEVLVKKAAVDAEFRELLLAQRGGAAASIELELDPAESAMLGAIPQEQLARIVDQTEVATELRPAFAGRIGAVMLAALGAGLVASSSAKPAGVQSDQPQGVASVSEPSVSTNATSPPTVGFAAVGNVAEWQTSPAPSNPPLTNPLPVVIEGIRVDVPPATNSPPVIIKGLRADVVPATNALPTNPPPTNPPAYNRTNYIYTGIRPTDSSATNPPSSIPTNAIIRGIQPNEPPVIVAGLMMRVPPPNPPETNPPAKSPDETK